MRYKKFDIEKAKKGAIVCRRDGTQVKILDFDYNGKVIYKYKDEFGGEHEEEVNSEGICLDPFDEPWERENDIFMAPVYAYMNVYKNEENMVLVGGVVRATPEECKETKSAELIPNTKWFCTARVELLLDEEGGDNETIL